MLRVCSNKGFHIEFSNGWLLSVQFGGGNYCDNYDQPILGSRSEPPPPSSNAEIAAWHRDGDMIQWDGDTVCGRVSADAIGRIIGIMVALPDAKTPEAIAAITAPALTRND